MTGLTRRALLSAATLTLPWKARATPIPSPENASGGVPVSVLILNSGTAPDWLIGATSLIAQEISLHTTHLEDGQRVMHQVATIAIPAGSVTSLEPGASHVMLTGMRQSLVQGRVFPLVLQFANAGSVPVEVRIRRKQDAAGVPETPPVVTGSLTILHASAPPAPAAHG